MCETNRNSLLTATFEYWKSFDQYTLIYGAQQLQVNIQTRNLQNQNLQ